MNTFCRYFDTTLDTRTKPYRRVPLCLLKMRDPAIEASMSDALVRQGHGDSFQGRRCPFEDGDDWGGTDACPWYESDED